MKLPSVAVAGLVFVLCLVSTSVGVAQDAPVAEARSQRLEIVETKVVDLLADADLESPTEEFLNALDATSDDPITLRALARRSLTQGDEARGRFLFQRALAHEEINLYERLEATRAAHALTLEFMGDFEGARAVWGDVIQTDPLTAHMLSSRYSTDPDLAGLLQKIRDHVDGLVKAAVAGDDAPIYVPAPGRQRNLKVLSGAEALEAFREGRMLRYAYIEELDLSGQTFENTVACQRCVVGSIKGYNSNFQGRFLYRGFVLGDLNLGKSWTGEVNRSRAIGASTFESVLLDKVVVLGDLSLNSVEVKDSAGVLFTVVEGEADFRNTVFGAQADFRYSESRSTFNLKGAELRGPAYFGHLRAGGLDLTRVTAERHALLFNSARFSGAVEASKCELGRGGTFEDAVFLGPVALRDCRVGHRLNFSRARFYEPVSIKTVQVDDILFLGSHFRADAVFSDSVVNGNARFALDGHNRLLHLEDVTPLHPLYKHYQGDVDADELLTNSAQYGVVHVDDLTTRFDADVSFANTIFEKFVGFERVTFGSNAAENHAGFYNSQFYGEAHFEHAHFQASADFRTISGNEISFNGARFEGTWMLDDANVPGRLSVNDLEFRDDATLSFYGARLAHFGILTQDLTRDDGSRLYYERCLDGAVDVDDPRLLAARWDLQTESARAPDAIESNVREICLDRVIGEFVVLRDSFTSRGMTEDADWAYWKLRHYTNFRDRQEATGLGVVVAWSQWLVFEKAFGWGVHLINLFWTSLVVIIIFMILMRVLCGTMVVEWDDEPLALKDMPFYALFVISLHSFLGRARDWKSRSSNKVWKVLYTSEMIIGILLITFFIGAYARIILR